MTSEEAETLGQVLRKAYGALRQYTDAERIYQLSTMEGQPHYHCWIVPRGKEITERGLKFLARDDSCSDEAASALAKKLSEAMKK